MENESLGKLSRRSGRRDPKVGRLFGDVIIYRAREFSGEKREGGVFRRGRGRKDSRAFMSRTHVTAWKVPRSKCDDNASRFVPPREISHERALAGAQCPPLWRRENEFGKVSTMRQVLDFSAGLGDKTAKTVEFAHSRKSVRVADKLFYNFYSPHSWETKSVW